MNFLFCIIGICVLSRYVIAEEQHCSRYHYEAQTLERIIKAEFTIADMKNEMDEHQEKNANDYSKLEERVKVIELEFENFVKNNPETTAEKQPLSVSSMRQFCISDNMCSDIENAECKWATCKCQPGLSYQNTTRKCLPDCGEFGYGDTYQIEDNTYLSGFNDNELTSVTVEQCLKRCSMTRCRSVEYIKDDYNCRLSYETLHSNPDAKGDGNNYVVFTRDCKN